MDCTNVSWQTFHKTNDAGPQKVLNLTILFLQKAKKVNTDTPVRSKDSAPAFSYKDDTASVIVRKIPATSRNNISVSESDNDLSILGDPTLERKSRNVSSESTSISYDLY